MSRIAVLSAVRTPIGKFMGAFDGVSAVELGETAVRAALERAGVTPDKVDETILGQARQAGNGPNPARQVAFRAGIPQERPAWTLNQACGSGLQALLAARDRILLDESRIAVAGGMENMSQVPYLLPKARTGYRLGHAPLVDAMYQDGFGCPLADQLMGATAETLADQYTITRDEQDAYAARSQQRAEAAWEAGRFADEITPVTVTGRKGSVVVDRDEHPRAGVIPEALAKLPPVFRKDGTVTAGNASGITDGAAALVLASEAATRELGATPLGWLEDGVTVGVDPHVMGIGPVPAVRALEARTGRALSSYTLVELNEAFAAQVLAVDRELRMDPDRLNVNGGAIALGHPIGCSGARIVVTLLHELRRRGGGSGLATLCVSGGMGVAAALSTED